VSETREVLRSEAVALVRRDGARVSPFVAAGELDLVAVRTGDGVVGRCIDTGSVIRTVVPSEPFFAGVAGPIAVLAAPLVADGHVIGALIAASRTSVGFDENDEMAIALLAFLGAGDVIAAQRFDSTLAMAQRDALTGLLNRRRLDGDLAARAGNVTPVAFLMIDVDHFKAFNDAFGHQRGDDLLRSVAAAISDAVREGDVVYRYGGEEFCVLLPDADAAIAGVVAERVRAGVRAATEHGPRPVTVSVGVASHDRGGAPWTLVERADAALYAAKQTGRDRVVMNTVLR
jgi:diguanylate cyclase (GGDEF)-like protein